MTFYKTSEILKKLNTKYQKQSESAQICYLCQKIVEKIFPQNQAQVKSFRNSTLTIETHDPAISFEVKLKSEELKNKINQKLKKDLIQKIRVRIF